MFDDAVAWLVARGRPGRSGTEPLSARPSAVERGHGWAGVPGLPGAYERLGVHRVGSFDVDGWPGAVLARSVGRR